MARSQGGRNLRVRKLQSRVLSTANDHFAICTIMGCGKPTTRSAKRGLSPTLCRKHVLFRQRHGSTWCPSPTATALRPYIRSAMSFIELHREEPAISAALMELDWAMETAGPVVIATRLRGLSPSQRARVALARLRDAQVRPERLLAIALAVHGLIQEAPVLCHRIKEWRIVAIAKAVHRLSSGYHRVWESADGNGHTRRTELHAYPRSAGRILRHLGNSIEKECEWVIDRYLAPIVVLKVSRYGPHPSAANPDKFAIEHGHQLIFVSR
jgi:hypothetical protein